MKYPEKTKDQLISELQKVQQKYDSLKELYDSDIIEIEQAEEVLKNTEEMKRVLKFITLFDFASEQIFTLNKDFVLNFVNESAARKFNSSSENLIGKSLDELFPSEHLELLKLPIQKVFSTGLAQYHEKETKILNNSVWLHTSFSPIYSSDRSQIISVLGISTDITDRKLVEMKLQESEGKYRTLFENIPIGIGVTDLTGKLIAFNDAILAPGSYSRDDLIRIGNVENLYYNLSDRETLIALLKEKGTIKQHHIKLKRKDGSPYDALLSLSTIYINDRPFIQSVVEDITERKLVEESLRFFRMMIDKSNDAIEVIDVETARFMDVNEKACTDLGYSRSELLSMSVFEIDPTQKMHDFQLITQNISQSNAMTVESLHRRKDGSLFPVEIKIAVVKLEKTYIVANVRDVTEKKLVENKLKRSEEQLKEAQSVGHIGNWELDLVKNTGTMSDEMYKLFDLNNSINFTIETFLTTPIPEDRQKVRELVMKSLETHVGIDFDFRTITSNGEIRWIHERSSIELDEKGNPIRVFGTCQDITEQKLSEVALLRINKAVEGSGESICMSDPQGHHFYHNKAFTEIFEYTMEEIEAAGGGTIIYLNKDVGQKVFDIIMGGGTWNGEVEMLSKSGRKFTILLRADSIKDENGIIVGLVGIHTDMTERKQTEEEIKLKNAQLLKLNAEKDKFFSIIAHDLRGPLGGLMGLTEIMADVSQNITPEEKHNLTFDLSKSARNIFTLLENLLEWSQMQRGQTLYKPQVLDLKEVLNDCMQIINDSARIKAIDISIDLADEQKIFADMNMLKTIIRNLVSNAIKFTPKGGKVTISAVSGNENTILFAIKDTGIGINDEMLGNLFTLGTKSQRPGTEGEPSTGLGLMLCKDFIEKHGGKIWVESKEGKGSVFYFTLPDFTEPEDEIFTKNVVPSESADKAVKKLKILVVEDDNISEKLISLAINKLAKEIIKVRTGVEAVEACRNNPDLDLVLMDIRMPEMDGLEATRQIRQFNKDVIIIAQTAYAFAGDSEKAIEAGCNDYISKPIDRTLLYELIGKHCNKPMINFTS